jgi:hypothetical protein
MNIRISFISLALVLILGACRKENISPNGALVGSMSRFIGVGQYLYTVDNTTLKIMDLSDPRSPRLVSGLEVGFGIETIFAHNQRLFLGARQGMYIFDITDPAFPAPLGSYSHVFSCDPVVVNDSLAFVTLRSGATCPWNTGNNRLDVVDIRQPQSPRLLRTVEMEDPHGLALKGNWLFVCDGAAGLKVFDISNAQDPRFIIGYQGNFRDVIVQGDLLLVVGPNYLYQYEASNPLSLQLLSIIQIMD